MGWFNHHLVIEFTTFAVFFFQKKELAIHPEGLQGQIHSDRGAGGNETDEAGGFCLGVPKRLGGTSMSRWFIAVEDGSGWVHG